MNDSANNEGFGSTVVLIFALKLTQEGGGP